MRKSLGTERVTSVFHWVLLAKYLPRFLTVYNLDFVRPDKEGGGSANKIFNTFCEWLDGAVCYFCGSSCGMGGDSVEALRRDVMD
ncbi:MAG: hypothetical protein ABSC55_16380 [Syntrophorhabdales bacterium]|jgi:hypothetical protein